MTEARHMPRYMERLLQDLGWNMGTRIPLANPENQAFENQLLARQNEIQRLKEASILQQQKQDDLDKYKKTVLTEYQENTRLLFAHKNQMEQEVKLRQLACNEADALDRDIRDCQKKSKDLANHVDRFQGSISKLLQRADSLKAEVCGERGALQEWRASIERTSGDITAIEMFTKQDTSRYKALETKRQQLKVEHDHMHERLTQLMSNLAAEERACERISIQVKEGMEQRKQMMVMWSAAVENLRQRDTDIRHIREDYAVLDEAANKVADEVREAQAFCDQQHGNNVEAERENMNLTNRTGQYRIAMMQLAEANVTLDSEMKSLQRELSSVQLAVEKYRIENRQIITRQNKKDKALSEMNQKIADLKSQLEESLDKSKSAEKRAKQLEQLLTEEEQYASNLTTNQQRAIHCTFVEQQKLLELQNEEKLINMQLKASKAIIQKLEQKQIDLEKRLQSQKESLYTICYQVETIGARVLHMEGAKDERECSAELVVKENRLKDVWARHAARVTLLERHSARLHDDMRRLARDMELKNIEHSNLESRLKSAMLNVDGGGKDLKHMREVWRRERVEEALLRLRVTHTSRAVAGCEDVAFTLDNQRLYLEAAMSERLVEIAARRDIFAVQKRSLLEDCGKLRAEIRERHNRIDQLIKRYDIFIASLGKDDSGQQVSMSFFKIKFAAERAELREKGAALDADIRRRERDMSALEATMRVVAAAHNHFLHHISPLAEDTPEIDELNDLTKEYYRVRDVMKWVKVDMDKVGQKVADLTAKATMLSDKYKQLSAREMEAESELETCRERVSRQESRLQNARDIVKHYTKRAKKLIEGIDDWRNFQMEAESELETGRGRVSRQESRLQNARDIVKHYTKRAKKLIEGIDDWRNFQMALWVRDYAEAAHNALHSMHDICSAPDDRRARFAALLAATTVERHMSRDQRQLLHFVQRLVADSAVTLKDIPVEIEESVFSSSSESVHSGLSIASGFTRRLATLRKTLASRMQEPGLESELPEIARRSTVSLKVVTLGLEENVPPVPAAKSISRTLKIIR